MDDKNKAAMEAALERFGEPWSLAMCEEIAFEKGYTSAVKAHDAEKLVLAYIIDTELIPSDYVHEKTIARRVIAEAKEDTDG